MLDAGGLGAGERMSAHEALVLAGVFDDALGRADIGHDAVRRSCVESLAHGLGERPDGCRREHDPGAGHGLGQVGGLCVDCAQLERARADGRVRVIAANLGVCAPARGQADRASDQPDAEDRDPHAGLSAFPAIAATCSTELT